MIAFLITGLNYGGAETQMVRLARALKARAWKVGVISMLPPQAFTEELKSAGIELATLNMHRGRPDPRAVIGLVGLLRQWKPLILTTIMFHANLLGRIAGWLAGVPIIVSSIRNENFGGSLRDRAMWLTDWMGDITTTNSKLAADKLVKRRVVPEGRIRVIPNGLVVDRFAVEGLNQIAVRRELGVAEDEFLWLAVGRLEQQKNYPNLLRAFQILGQSSCRAKLRVAGQGPLLEALRQQAADMRISEYVTFLGLRRDIPLLLCAADGFVLSSSWEGLPNVVMEAMAAAKPVVATCVGGVPELVQHGINGYIVPPDDPQALAAAMIKMMSLPEAERKAMGQAGRAHVEAKYSLDGVVDQWEALYAEMLGKRGLTLK